MITVIIIFVKDNQNQIILNTYYLFCVWIAYNKQAASSNKIK